MQRIQMRKKGPSPILPCDFPNLLPPHPTTPTIPPSKHLITLLSANLLALTAPLLLSHHANLRLDPLKIRAHIATPYAIIMRLVVVVPYRAFLLRLPRLTRLPILPHLLNLLSVIRFGIVVLAHAAKALPQRQMLRVHRYAVVVLLATCADVLPPALLLFEVEACGVGEEEEGEQHACEAEPGHDVEFGLRVDIIVEHGGSQGAQFSDRGGEAVGRGADGGGVHLGSDEEGHGVGAELVEEGGEEVHGLEGVDVRGLEEEVVVEGGDDEEDEVGSEADHLHPFAAIELVIDEKC